MSLNGPCRGESMLTADPFQIFVRPHLLNDHLFFLRNPISASTSDPSARSFGTTHPLITGANPVNRLHPFANVAADRSQKGQKSCFEHGCVSLARFSSSLMRCLGLKW